MLGLDGDAVLLHQTAQVHEATHVAADKCRGSGIENALDLLHPDARAHGRVTDREGSAKAAALLGLVDGHEFDARDRAQEDLLLVRESDSASVAGPMIGDFLALEAP